MESARGLDDLLDLAEAGATIVTATHHLARHLREAHDGRALARGALAWAGVDALPVDAWLRRLHADALAAGAVAPRAVLSTVQEQALWEALAGQMLGAATPGAASALAVPAADAWRILREAGADATVLASESGADATRLARCFDAFTRRLVDEAWIDAASIPGSLAAAPLERSALPGAVVVAGFDRLAADLTRLLAALEQRGVRTVRLAEDTQGAGVARREVFATPAAEAWETARWTRAVLDARPQARIGIVVPDLAARRAELVRAFEEFLMPDPDARREGASRPFTVSLGEPLAAAPCVADALGLLTLATSRVDPGTLARVLVSPHLAGADAERAVRAVLAGAVRGAGEASFAMTDALALVARTAAEAAPALVAALTAVRETIAANPGRRGAGVWADLAWRAVTAAGWPGERALDSETYQTVEALRDTLSALASLEAVGAPMSGADACARLSALCSERVFAPRADPAPVEITGLLETAGQHFTHLRILGMDDVAWPPPARPNPLLPVRLQARLEAPRCTPALSLAHAAAVSGRLLSSADEIVVSHAQRHGDEVRRASPLFDLPPVLPGDASAPVPPESYTDRLARHAPVLERIDDPPLPRLPVGTLVRGGVRVLQDQAACGFRAFARHRLLAGAAEPRDTALDALERGAIVHRVLEHVWRSLDDRERLLASSRTELERLVASAVSRVLADAARLRPAVRGRLRDIEQRRLERLIIEWLEGEAARPDFQVAAPEHDARVRVGPLVFAMRPDRVDRLADGRFAVIDYKTGAPRISDWFGERPDDPQIPLYASRLATSGGVALDVAMAAFARVRVRPPGPGMAGLADGPDHGTGVTDVADSTVAEADGVTDWRAVLARWRTTHDALAEDFAAGRAEVDPKLWPKTCQYCEIRALCRVDETHRAAPGAEDSA